MRHIAIELLQIFLDQALFDTFLSSLISISVFQMFISLLKLLRQNTKNKFGARDTRQHHHFHFSPLGT